MRQGEKKTLGAFLGVYTPTILTILGVIMYLRFGWIVGNYGLGKTILIALIANSITLITTLSFSSMATNMKVGAGGAYYIISRSLGLGIGAAVGIPLFLSQALSVTLYSFGLAETLRIVWPDVPLDVATLVLIILATVVSAYGARFALRTQIPLLILVGVSIAALAYGAFVGGREIILPLQDGPHNPDFWFGFALFFPAVTGVMAGLSLSGDLKEPSRSIPLGAIAATLTGLVIYLLVPWILSQGARPEELRADPLIWLTIAPFGAVLVLPGLWGAIFSSAVGSGLGAPRTLQSIVADQFSNLRFRSWVRSVGGERTALIIALLIAAVAVTLGDLNAVAQVVSMFFLTIYGTVNFAAGLESLSGDTSWRPKFKIPWALNILCGLACLWVMFLISPLWSVIAIVVELGLWLLLVRREQMATWGDARRGLYESLLRWTLLKLTARPMSTRNWRPHILVFVDDPERKINLLRFASLFSQNRGVVSVCQLIVGKLDETQSLIQEKLGRTRHLLERQGLRVFPEIDVVGDIVSGIVSVSQANGIAGFASNTIVLGWPTERDAQVNVLRVSQNLSKLNKSVIIGKVSAEFEYLRRRRSQEVHVWWGGLRQNGDLMLLLAFLLTRDRDWRNAEVTILSAASNEETKLNTEKYLTSLLENTRIEARSDVFIRDKSETIGKIMSRRSSAADVVLMGLSNPSVGEEESYAERLDDLTAGLPAVFLVKNNTLFIGELLKPEDDQGEKAPSRLPSGENMGE